MNSKKSIIDHRLVHVPNNDFPSKDECGYCGSGDADSICKECLESMEKCSKRKYLN